MLVTVSSVMSSQIPSSPLYHPNDLSFPPWPGLIDLKYGEMVKLPDLSMMDAMNALVILDPRMDTGCSASSSSSSSSSTSQTETNAGSRQGDVKDMELDPEVVVGIMDRLMQLEVS
jgi:hypothetical protein